MSDSLVNSTNRVIGESGLKVGPMAFGCWRFTNTNLDVAQSLLEAAIDRGMTLIDTADVYGLDFGGTGFGGNEEILGAVLSAAPHLRDRIVLATKGGIRPPVPYDSSDTYLRNACEASLRRLQVNTIDLYQIHRPDLFTHPEQVAETLTELRDAGKIREVGVSNHTPGQYASLAAYLPFPLATSQPEYSLAHLDPVRDGTFDVCMRDSVVPLTWGPLAGGRLISGVSIRPELMELIDHIALREDVDRAAVCYAFVLAHPSAPIPILGTQTVARLDDALASFTVSLDRSDVYALIQASEGVPLP